MLGDGDSSFVAYQKCGLFSYMRFKDESSFNCLNGLTITLDYSPNVEHGYFPGQDFLHMGNFS